MEQAGKMARVRVGKIAANVVIVIALIVAMAPILWIIFSSFKSRIDIISSPPKFIFTPVIDNYARVFQMDTIVQGLKNSLIVVPCTVALGFLLGVPVAYIFARFSFKRKKDLRFFILSLRFMPPIAVVIPFFTIWLRLGLLDTKIGLIVTYMTISVSSMIWLVIECFRRIPIEYEEAAQLEGLDHLQVLVKISLKIALPSILGMTIFVFILVWNEFFLAFVLTSHNAVTMPVASAAFAVVGMEVPWGQICASITLLLLPPLVLSYFFMKYLPNIFNLK
jgi:multiple sugar transport system permease protein